MIALAPSRATVSSFHELCVDHYRSRHEEPDFSDPAIFSRITDAYSVDSASFPPRFDLLVDRTDRGRLTGSARATLQDLLAPGAIFDSDPGPFDRGR